MSIVTLLFLMGLAGLFWHEARWAEREVIRAQSSHIARYVQDELDNAA